MCNEIFSSEGNLIQVLKDSIFKSPKELQDKIDLFLKNKPKINNLIHYFKVYYGVINNKIDGDLCINLTVSNLDGCFEYINEFHHSKTDDIHDSNYFGILYEDLKRNENFTKLFFRKLPSKKYINNSTDILNICKKKNNFEHYIMEDINNTSKDLNSKHLKDFLQKCEDVYKVSNSPCVNIVIKYVTFLLSYSNKIDSFLKEVKNEYESTMKSLNIDYNLK